jgi:hypothetical protein
VENATIAEMHDVPACPLSGSAGTAVRRGVHEGEVKVTERQAAELFRCPVVYIADDDNVYMPALWPVLRRVMRVALFSTGNLAHDAIEVSLSQTCKMPSSLAEQSTRIFLRLSNVLHELYHNPATVGPSMALHCTLIS